MLYFMLGLTTGLVISLASLIIMALNYKNRGHDDEDDEW